MTRLRHFSPRIGSAEPFLSCQADGVGFPDDVSRVVARCRVLAPAASVYLTEDFVTNLLETVVDFQMVTSTVVKAIEHYKHARFDEIRTMTDLLDVMDRFPDDKVGNTALAQHLWGYNLWTRAHMLRELVDYFNRIGIRDQSALRSWAASSDFEHDFRGKVKGLGYAVYQWLVMRQGVETVKPDVHLHRFVEAAVGRPLADSEVVLVVEEAARVLGLPAYELDWSIWEFQRNAQPFVTAGQEQAGPLDPDPAANDPLEVKGRIATETHGAIEEFRDDHSGYLRWLGANPTGYVINCDRAPKPGYLVLHRRHVVSSPVDHGRVRGGPPNTRRSVPHLWAISITGQARLLVLSPAGVTTARPDTAKVSEG